MNTTYTTMRNGAKDRILMALYEDGLSAVTELMDKLGMDRNRVVDNAAYARKKGLVVSKIDQFTNEIAYQLTNEGREFVRNMKNSNLAKETDAPALPALDISQIFAQMESIQQDNLGKVKDIPQRVVEDVFAVSVFHDGSQNIELVGPYDQAVERAIENAKNYGVAQTVFRLEPVGSTLAEIRFVTTK